MPPKRKRSVAAVTQENHVTSTQTNPQINPEIVDAPDALRASPDSDVDMRMAPGRVKKEDGSESPLSEMSEVEVEPPKKKKSTNKAPAKRKPASAAVGETGRATEKAEPVNAGASKAKRASKDMDAEGEEEADEEADEDEVQEALSRPPPVNSDYLPLPWKGRLGYACLNTYLRYSTPPVFSSRTCRIASILEHRHPLKDPTQPEHATKNRPDRDQPADMDLGRKYVESICLANARDIIKMIRWNDKYGIKFLRLSSEMFPFASHEEYGYKLEPFAAEALAEAGKVIAELGHRVTTHPGQYTQLGSPRKSVIDNAFRDLEYHDEMLSLLKLPEQMDRDAVMILHIGGMFGDKAATLDRFRENYAKLSQSVKNRLVLENDDVIWSVHDVLPICEELNIPMVLDFHHHNIIFDADKIREGTADIMNLFPRIKATWDRKNIKQKMHYSEPTPAAITGRQRRKHSPRVATLPPCAQDMDLMIEAKDKEQAVFELMRIFKLPGHETFNNIIPHVRPDDNKAALAQAGKSKATSKKTKRKAKASDADQDCEEDTNTLNETTPQLLPDDEVGMGGPDGRVYWPPGMEDWLRPKKREVKPKKEPGVLTPAQKKKQKAAAEAAALSAASLEDVVKDQGADESDEGATPATKKAKAALRAKAATQRAKASALAQGAPETKVIKAAAPRRKAAAPVKVKKEKATSTPLTSEAEDDDDSVPTLDTDADEPATPLPDIQVATGARKSKRASKAQVSYQEADMSTDDA